MKLSRTELYVSHETRLASYAAVSTALSLLSDEQLRERVENAQIVGIGIGGSTALLQLEDRPIFAKIIPLTELESRTPNVMSTRNVFELPPYCHYGIGPPAGGVWREIAAHIMTTNWVLSKQCESFPIMYHWRVLHGSKPRTTISEDPGEVSRKVEYWGSQAVGNRIEAIKEAKDSVVLFCEFIPYNLHEWLVEKVAIDEKTASSAIAMVDSNLRSAVSFMNANRLFHFDVHCKNILTDGHRIYITDFGLATSSRFELSESEVEFIERNKAHDGCYVVTELANWLVTVLGGARSQQDRVDFIRQYAQGLKKPALMDTATELIKRYAPIALAMNDFYANLGSVSRATPFPAEEIQAICSDTGFEP
ncbi:protein kinase domain-containing protein [Paenibacillus albus]|uniref:Protein kinase family protein n=1 Tax=Paenibacillus albus TaxID=2495582 RepID=A0A3S9A6G6_9BACL|nr:protein kinase [Paenibacillus albus]AZN41359.1 protein kinase family protein [Paenibacillus albus]